MYIVIAVKLSLLNFHCVAMHNIPLFQHSNFSDLSLSQPLCELARLCLYADTQLHTHIGMT